MAWWSWRPGGQGQTDGIKSRNHEPGAAALGALRVPDDLSTLDNLPAASRACEPAGVTLDRIGAALDLLDIRYLSDGDGNLLAMWERHAVLFTMEGPEDEILVIRARPHATVAFEFADRAYRAVNEWNHLHRFAKAYVGDPTLRGELPIYAETQVPLRAGAHDALVVELVDCGAAVATAFVEWLHEEASLL